MIEITNSDRIRTIRLMRPEAKNAMNEAMWDAVTEALLDAAVDRSVAVVVFTGSGDSFCAGADVIEMAMRNMGTLDSGAHGFPGFADAFLDFPKPFIAAVNGIGIGFGATILGLSDLVFMSTTARIKCPFTSLAVAPEFASSYSFPRLIGRQNATWALMSSEWLTAEQCDEMGLVFKLCAPDELVDVTMEHARILSSKPISSLIESKRVMTAAMRPQIDAARAAEDAAFGVLMGAPANIEAFAAFAEKREPNFADID